jgi:hypothetical protein
MESADIAWQIYQQIVERLTTRFNSEGYQIVHEQNDDMVFGSCYTIWSNDQDILRLTWDGKEGWFTLEESLLPISGANHWLEIIITPFDPYKHDMAHAKIIMQDIMDSLGED